jgi:hypothetical protein
MQLAYLMNQNFVWLEIVHTQQYRNPEALRANEEPCFPLCHSGSCLCRNGGTPSGLQVNIPLRRRLIGKNVAANVCAMMKENKDANALVDFIDRMSRWMVPRFSNVAPNSCFFCRPLFHSFHNAADSV